MFRRKIQPPFKSSGAYVVAGDDTVEEISGVPQSSTGAPLPRVIAGEQEVFLLYLAQDSPENSDGSSIRSVDGNDDELITTIMFIEPYAHYFGPPNDETMSGHPLYERGLKHYSCSKVNSSSWIRALEKMNSVHARHRKDSFDNMNHFIFCFHDSIFECVADAICVLNTERTTITKAIEKVLPILY